MQGHCKALFLSIERLLGVLRVDRVVLPAAEGAEGIWLNKFGFSKMANDQVCLYCLYVELTRLFHQAIRSLLLLCLVLCLSCLLPVCWLGVPCSSSIWLLFSSWFLWLSTSLVCSFTLARASGPSLPVSHGLWKMDELQWKIYDIDLHPLPKS
jgi:hypothetical protein